MNVPSRFQCLSRSVPHGCHPLVQVFQVLARAVVEGRLRPDDPNKIDGLVLARNGFECVVEVWMPILGTDQEVTLIEPLVLTGTPSHHARPGARQSSPQGQTAAEGRSRPRKGSL